mmetsp:Transcript_133934/g.317577  ORF Transcript_133934/g.317577 Transcript_133934/m.317577 type:complete len:250 (+) Transcript_133934:1138-1887(+)
MLAKPRRWLMQIMWRRSAVANFLARCILGECRKRSWRSSESFCRRCSWRSGLFRKQLRKRQLSMAMDQTGYPYRLACKALLALNFCKGDWCRCTLAPAWPNEPFPRQLALAQGQSFSSCARRRNSLNGDVVLRNRAAVWRSCPPWATCTRAIWSLWMPRWKKRTRCWSPSSSTHRSLRHTRIWIHTHVPSKRTCRSCARGGQRRCSRQAQWICIQAGFQEAQWLYQASWRARARRQIAHIFSPVWQPCV